MNTLYLLLVTLWGAALLEAAVTALGLAAPRRRTSSSGIYFLACTAVAGLAASHWFSLAPRFDPRYPGLAFLGAMLLPAAAVLRLEVEAGYVRGRLGSAAILAGALLPAALLPAQIVGAEVCVASHFCAPARPFILLTHLGTGALLLLMAVPAVGQLARGWRLRSLRDFRPSAGLLLLAMAFVHLVGVLARVGADTDSAARDLAEAALMVLFLRGMTRAIRREYDPAALAALPLAVAATPLPGTEPAQSLADATSTACAEECEPESNSQIDDPVQLAEISARAMADLRENALYRQPQLRRKTLAERLQVPEYLLSRALNASTGHSFIELVNGLRIEEAKRRLRSGSERVTTIGYDVGFNSLGAFNRAFREATGQSPSEFRVSPVTPALAAEPGVIHSALPA